MAAQPRQTGVTAINGFNTNLFELNIPNDPNADYTTGGTTLNFLKDFNSSPQINGIFVEEFTLASALNGTTSVELLTIDLEVTFQRAPVNLYSGFTAGVEDTRESLIYVHDGPASSNTYDIYGQRHEYMEEAMTGNDLSDGADNIFQNNGNAAKNIERVDYVYQDGFNISQAAYTNVGFAFFERDRNNQFYVAAITDIDANGNATDFGQLVHFGGETTSQTPFPFGPEQSYTSSAAYGLPSGSDYRSLVVQGNPDVNNPSSFDYGLINENITNQGIGGVYLTLGNLGLAQGDTFYGYALFGGDQAPVGTPGWEVPVDITDSWYKRNTGSTPGGGDLYGGGMLFIPDNLTLDPGAFTPLGQNLYWDLNDGAVGSGVMNLPTLYTNVWSLNTNLGEDGDKVWGNATGQLTTTEWTQGKTAVFSAGQDAVGSYTVEVDDAVEAHGLKFEDGFATLEDENGNAGSIALVSRVDDNDTPGDTSDDVTLRPFIDVSAGLAAVVDVDLLGTEGFDKDGLGEVTLSGDNTYTGPTNVLRGEVFLDGGNGIGDTSLVTLDGGTAMRLLASETIGALTGSGEVHLNSSTLTVGDNRSTTFDGLINGGAASGLTKEGTGILTLTNENTFTGLTQINEGQINLNTSTGNEAISRNIIIGDNIGGTGDDRLLTQNNEQIGDDAHITINGTGRLDIDGHTETIGDLASGFQTAQIDLGLNGELIVQQDGNTTYAGTFEDTAGSTTGELSLYGSGELTLANTTPNAIDFEGKIALYGDDVNTPGSGEATTLTLASSNIINDAVDLELAGGRLRLDNVNETFGELSLTGDSSFIDFTNQGDGVSSGLLEFTQLGTSSNFVVIENWVGSPGIILNDVLQSGGGGDNQLILGSTSNLGSTKNVAGQTAVFDQPVGDRFIFEGYGEAIYVDSTQSGKFEIIPTLNGFFEWDSGGVNDNWDTDDNWVGTSPQNPGGVLTQGDGQWALFDDEVPDGDVIIVNDRFEMDQILITTQANISYRFEDVGTTDGDDFRLTFGDSNSGGLSNNRNTLTVTGNADVDFDTDLLFTDDFTLTNNGSQPLTFNRGIDIDDSYSFIPESGNDAETLEVKILGSGTTVINGDLTDTSGTGQLIMDGSGTLELTGSSDWSGGLVINSGTVLMNNEDGVGSENGDNTTWSTGTIELNGGTLLLGADNQIGDNVDLILNGGTLALNGYSDNLGTLTLRADSVIDFGDLASDVRADTILDFFDSSAENWDPDATLTVRNWRGTPVDGDGFDQLIVGLTSNGLTNEQLSQIVFEGHGPLIHLPDGEIVPVPEPRAYAAMAGLLLFVAWWERRRLQRIWQQWRVRRG